MHYVKFLYVGYLKVYNTLHLAAKLYGTDLTVCSMYYNVSSMSRT